MFRMLALLLTFAPAERWSDTNEEVFAARKLAAKSNEPALELSKRDKLRRQAVAIYDGVIEARPDHPTAHLSRARLLVRLGDLGTADAAFRLCVEATPHSGQCIEELAEMYIDQGYVDLGVQVLEAGPKAMTNLQGARAKLIKGDAKAAIAMLDENSGADADDAFFSGYAYALLHKKDDAIGILELVLADDGAGPGVKRAAESLIAKLKRVI